MSDRHGTLVLVQGFAGSGKSHLIALLKRDFLIEENFAATNESEARNIDDLARELRAGRHCIVSERKYRSNSEREEFLKRVMDSIHPSPAPAITVICFEKDIDSANHNCKARTNKLNDKDGVGHIQQNITDAETYDIPNDAIVIKIHRI